MAPRNIDFFFPELPNFNCQTNLSSFENNSILFIVLLFVKYCMEFTAHAENIAISRALKKTNLCGRGCSKHVDPSTFVSRSQN